MPLSGFNPAVSRWFQQKFAGPTEVQRQAWPAIGSGRHVLMAAPTGSGKTLAAFLSAIDGLVRDGLGSPLADETRVLYVSPLKALSNDVEKNLRDPLAGIGQELEQSGMVPPIIRAAVRTGDTPASERARMVREPPHILVTTPESLYSLLGSDSGRAMLASVETVIIDELHALAGNKRGAHLALSLARLDELCQHRPVRIGVSATQKPMSTMAAFLMGEAQPDCDVVDTGFVRERDLALELPPSGLSAVMATEVWVEIYDRLAELAGSHRSTLVFVNTRRLAERAARHLGERLGEEAVAAHHGSMSRDLRLSAEQRLKAGTLKVVVATASLELGIDIGDVDLVCQLGSPRGIATWLQRVGRSGHAVGAVPKGRLFPLSRDELAECVALLQAVHREELEVIRIPSQPLDVLSQQLVAEVGSQDWDTDDLFRMVRRAWPYRELTRETFDAVVDMLADGFTTRRGRRGAHLHLDRVNGKVRGRRGAKLTAITNGGAIPDHFDYDVVLSPEGIPVGTVNEDFAFESLPGDIFQLGNTSYRILRVETSRVYVEDARGQPPNIPFWFGEAPGRSDELSMAVSRLRGDMSRLLRDGVDQARAWLAATPGVTPLAIEVLLEYLSTARAALSILPTHEHIVLDMLRRNRERYVL